MEAKYFIELMTRSLLVTSFMFAATSLIRYILHFFMKNFSHLTELLVFFIVITAIISIFMNTIMEKEISEKNKTIKKELIENV